MKDKLLPLFMLIARSNEKLESYELPSECRLNMILGNKYIYFINKLNMHSFYSDTDEWLI